MVRGREGEFPKLVRILSVWVVSWPCCGVGVCHMKWLPFLGAAYSHRRIGLSCPEYAPCPVPCGSVLRGSGCPSLRASVSPQK